MRTGEEAPWFDKLTMTMFPSCPALVETRHPGLVETRHPELVEGWPGHCNRPAPKGAIDSPERLADLWPSPAQWCARAGA